MKDWLVILLDLNSLSWIQLVSDKENTLDLPSLIGIAMDTIFLRYMQNVRG